VKKQTSVRIMVLTLGGLPRYARSDVVFENGVF